MYRRILVGYDGREPGRDALALAQTLRPDEGVVTAACVYPVTGHADNERLVADAAEQTLAEARMQVDGHWLECTRVPGQSPAHGLHVLSEKVNAHLVVVGSSHRAEHGRVHAGSTGERLLNGSPCPVAVAPTGFAADAHAPRVIGVAYDGSDGSETALREAMALAVEFTATLRIITAVPPLELRWSPEAFSGAIATGETIREQRRNVFRAMLEDAAARSPTDARAAAVLVDGHPATVIASEAEKGIHLLVMGSRNYGPLRRVMVGSTAIELMRIAPCPVLVVPRGAATPSAEAAESGATTAA
jgi:nucleotide-binding universal stress UspA family protein